MQESALPLPSNDFPKAYEAPANEIDLSHHAVLLEQEFPDVFELFYKVGIHPSRPSITPPLYLSRSVAPHRPNIGLHSIAVALCARSMAVLLGEHPGTPGVSVHEITRRALLHDIGKPFELMRRDLHKDVGRVYSEGAYSDVYKLLVNAGASETEALTVVTSGVDAGHLSVRRFLYVDHSGALQLIAGNIPGKIVHLADSMVVTTVPTATSDTRTYVCPPSSRILGSHARQRYPWLWDLGLALDGDREIVEIPDIHTDAPGCSVIGSYASVLAWAAKAICTEFVERMDVFALTAQSANRVDTDFEATFTTAVARAISDPPSLSLAS